MKEEYGGVAFEYMSGNAVVSAGWRKKIISKFYFSAKWKLMFGGKFTITT